MYVYADEEVNRLNWVEISQNRLSTQIMFDFVKPVHVKQDIDKPKRQLQLTFPGMRLQDFNPGQVVPKFSLLKSMGLVNCVEVFQTTGSITQVVVAIEFAPSRIVKNADNTESSQVNKFVIKWSTLERPYRLILEVFMKESLDNMQRDAVLLHASNDTVTSDVVSQRSDVISKAAEHRVVIDPGHGGSDTGAKGYRGLVEKEISLEIAKNVQAMLKKKDSRHF